MTTVPHQELPVAAREKLFTRLLAKKAISRSAPISIRPRDNSDHIPLSFAQQQLWFLDQLGTNRSVYNLSICLRIEGNLDLGVLMSSVEGLVERHESLRTRFVSEGGRPRQVIAEAGPVVVPVIDLREIESEGRERVGVELVGVETGRAFDLEQGPLMRVSVLCLGEEEHVLLIGMHHIISDGWSMGVLMRDLSGLYVAGVEGRKAELPAMPIQYADYALWQREWMQGERLQEQVRYWKEHLAGATGVLELPSDKRRPSVQSYGGANLAWAWPKGLQEGIRGLGQQNDSTLFMVLLAGLAVLLARYSGEEDIIVGAPIANRTRSELEGLIGLLVNTLGLRSRVKQGASFLELLQQVRETTLGAYGHQDLPFERLVEEMGVERDLSRTPLIQVMLVLQNAPVGRQEWPGVRLRQFGEEVAGRTAKFDLTLSLRETGEGLVGNLEYNTDVYEEASMRRLVGHYRRVLEQAVENAGELVGRLVLLSGVEREQVLEKGRGREVDYGEGGSLWELVREQMRRTGDAVAVVYEEEQISYGELEERVEEVARYLRRLGVGEEERVGLWMERSLEMVIGMMGVVGAGGVYVPLEPGYPEERLRYMVSNSGMKVVLTQKKLGEQARAVLWGRGEAEPGEGGGREGVRVVEVDGEWGEWEEWRKGVREEEAEEVVGRRSGEGLVYVIYTSGSTGQPKGVMVGQRGVINRLQWMKEEYGLGREDRVLQKTPYSFDVSVWEFFWPLLWGGCLVMARAEGHKDSGYLVEKIEEEQITTLHFVPAMLQAFVGDERVKGRCRTVRRVYSSGEALGTKLAEEFLERLPGSELHNLYGPTEATVDVSYWRCEKRREEERSLPIGRAVANTQLYVLDEEMEPVPLGVVGELYVGGVQVGRGYQGRAEQTAWSFVPDPYGRRAGQRLYRTGDQARVRGDGSLEYLGRLDHQVKIRGFRIELGEIEATLRLHPAVRQAVVVAREDLPGTKRLYAYVVPALQTDKDVSSDLDSGHHSHLPSVLRDFVQERLPEYMMPTAFFIIQQLPLNSNGKVDRKALPAPRDGAAVSNSSYLPAQTPMQRTLVEIWQQVLGLERVGIRDNFFALGGDSILSIQIVARARMAGI